MHFEASEIVLLFISVLNLNSSSGDVALGKCVLGKLMNTA